MSLLNRIIKDLTIKISTTAVSGLYFADLTSCMAWLHKRSIAANATVTINFDASYTGTESGTIAIAHPDAARIVIAGNATSTNISACTAATGAIGARSLTYTVASAAGLAVGDRFYTTAGKIYISAMTNADTLVNIDANYKAAAATMTVVKGGQILIPGGTAFTPAYCVGISTIGTINATTGAFIG